MRASRARRAREGVHDNFFARPSTSATRDSRLTFLCSLIKRGKEKETRRLSLRLVDVEFVYPLPNNFACKCPVPSCSFESVS